MTCQNPGQELELRFLSSGMRVRPLEMDVRMTAHEYAHGQFVLNESVGRFVGSNFVDSEPVELWFGQHLAHRFFMPQEALTFEQTLDKPTVAKLDVQDARQILARGNIEKSFTHTHVGDVIRYILNNRNDPEGVIQGVEYNNPADADEFLLAQGQPVVAGSTVTVGPKVPQIAAFFAEKLGLDSYTDPYVGFNFDGISPLQAMAEVMKELELDWAVDNQGVLQLGPHGTYGEIIGVAEEGTELEITRYDVTTSSNKTNAIRVMGPYQVIDPIPETTDLLTGEHNTRLRPVAEASAPGVSGSPMYLEAKSFENLAEFERAATRALFQEIMADSNGSMEINGLASTDRQAIADMKPGNHVIVDSSLEEHCAKSVATGAFLIERIHHRASRRQGWQILLELSEVAFAENIQTTSFYYDPQTEQTFDTLDSYNEYAYGEEPPFPIIPL